MKLIIDIPEKIYLEKKEDYIGDTLDNAIKNGTPLSKELEKIKAEIEPLPITDTAIRLVLKVIDKHI